MRVLVTGACGLLGSHFMAALGQHQVVGTDRHPWWGSRRAHVVQGDLTDDGFIEQIVRTATPQLVIHCAAAVDVDHCERDPQAAQAANVDVTRRLSMATPDDTLFLYMSTDSVFAGVQPFAAEESTPAPLNVYATSKRDAERLVEARRNHLIVRTNFYGWSSGRKTTFAEWLHASLSSAAPITLYDDVYFTPIYAVDLVEQVGRLVQRGIHGLVHVAGRERVSKYEFGIQLADVMGLVPTCVARGSVDGGRHAAPRPRDMSLSVDRVQRLLGVQMPGCRDGLSRFLHDWQTPLEDRFVQTVT